MRPGLPLLLAALLCGCATRAPAPQAASEQEPVIISSEPTPAEPSAQPAVEAAPAAPDHPARPGQTADGTWRVGVVSERTQKEAAATAARLEAQGLRANVETAKVKGTTWQRVVVPGLRSREDAQAMIGYLKQFGFGDAWVLLPAR